ncbi:hypothetical protein ACUR5C_06900 [Aliikangiella sp. IMCC44653]
MPTKNIFNDDEVGLLVHSYNNFLSGVMGFSELALLESSNQAVAERIQSCLVSANEGVTFGKELLSCLARIQVVMQPVELNQVLDLAEFSADDSLPNRLTQKINTNQKWMQHCFQQVVGFIGTYQQRFELASKAPQLIVSQREATIDIKILSNIELNASMADNLFRPFYSSRELLDKKDLGLAVVAGFITQMKGTIQWQGNGFHITLPLAS